MRPGQSRICYFLSIGPRSLLEIAGAAAVFRAQTLSDADGMNLPARPPYFSSVVGQGYEVRFRLLTALGELK